MPCLDVIADYKAGTGSCCPWPVFTSQSYLYSLGSLAMFSRLFSNYLTEALTLQTLPPQVAELAMGSRGHR